MAFQGATIYKWINELKPIDHMDQKHQLIKKDIPSHAKAYQRT